MQMDSRELWTVVHGMVFGFIFLLGASGAVYALYSLKEGWQTETGAAKSTRIIQAGLWVLAGAVWLAVLTGAYIVYPWYRATPPAGAYDLSQYPRYMLLSSQVTEQWHEFGMEWKEHVAFLAPFAATAAAYIATYYGSSLAQKPAVRRAAIWFFIFAFATASAAGLFGALITKAAPVK
jgi:hypothetical protein